MLGLFIPAQFCSQLCCLPSLLAFVLKRGCVFRRLRWAIRSGVTSVHRLLVDVIVAITSRLSIYWQLQYSRIYTYMYKASRGVAIKYGTAHGVIPEGVAWLCEATVSVQRLMRQLAHM